MNYEHKGVKITFDSQRAQFSASVGEKRLTAPSLDAIKKKIEAAQAIKFEPFTALIWYPDDLKVVKVTHVFKSESRYSRGEMVFCTESDYHQSHTREHSVLTPDTVENRRLVKEYQRMHKEGKAEIKKIEERIDKARHAIPKLKAADYVAAKTKS